MTVHACHILTLYVERSCGGVWRRPSVGDLFFSDGGKSSQISAGVPHAPTQDDIYEGYLIPKGSVLLSSGLRDRADVELI